MTCPHVDNVPLYLDEQLSVDESKRFEMHIEACPFCADALAETRSLIAAIKQDEALEEDPFVADVMKTIDTPPKVFPMRRVVAVAAALAMFVSIPLFVLQLVPSDHGAFTPRQGAPTAFGDLVDAEPILFKGNTVRPVDARTVLSAADGLTFQYTNHVDDAVYFMAFAVDAREEVHWFYPAYLSATSNPEAVRLANGQRGRLMPDIVQAEGVPAGAMKIVVVLSRKKRTVKEVEKLLRRTSESSLDTLFSDDDIVKTWTVSYQD